MGYRVRVHLDLDFGEDEASALQLSEAVLPFMTLAQELSSKAVNVNEGELNEEKGSYLFELCGHDKGLPCVVKDLFTVSTKGL